jgi:Sulfotransferase domain
MLLALEELGFPTLHMMHMYAYENEEIMQMLTDKIVKPAMEMNEPVVGRADLKLIAESGYQAVSNTCLFYEQILEEFPDCKFVLTTRENSEIWFNSWSNLTESITSTLNLGGLLFPTVAQYSNWFRWMNSVVNKDASHMNSTVPKQELIRENAIASYEEHNSRVREVIPPEQLLEFNVKDGWEPLCKFLEIEDCPSTPFPKSNSARAMRSQGTSLFWTATIVLLFVISKVFKPLLGKKGAARKKID